MPKGPWRARIEELISRYSFQNVRTLLCVKVPDYNDRFLFTSRLIGPQLLSLFGLLGALKIYIVLFGVIPPNSQVIDCKRFGEISCLLLKDRSEDGNIRIY